VENSVIVSLIPLSSQNEGLSGRRVRAAVRGMGNDEAGGG